MREEWCCIESSHMTQQPYTAHTTMTSIVSTEFASTYSV